MRWPRTCTGFARFSITVKPRISLTTPPAAGAPRDGKPGYELLYPLLDLTTTLDPRFNIAYRFGAIFLSAPLPGGAGRPDLAVALLEKGLRESPGKWEYMHDIGFVYYWDLHDYPKAAEYFNRGADMPGAPWWLRSVAATTLARGGDRGASRLLWRQLYETAPDDRGRQAASLKLLQLDALDQMEDLQSADRCLCRTTRRTAAIVADARRRGRAPGVPVDPGGTPYELSESGRVILSMSSTLFPLPLEPGPGPAPGDRWTPGSRRGWPWLALSSAASSTSALIVFHEEHRSCRPRRAARRAGVCCRGTTTFRL